MKQKHSNQSEPQFETISFKSALEEALRQGAREMLQRAIENEVTEYLQKQSNRKDSQGHQMVVRNGYLPQREIITGIGAVKVKQPRVFDREKRKSFTSQILPPYMRRVASIDNLIPMLYLKGVSTNDFPSALEAILGDQVKGLSATNIVRLKQHWESEYKDWSRRDLSKKQYVYWWVDGIYFNVRLDDERQCILIIIGATAEGKKELVAVVDGYRESKQSWKEVQLDLEARGLESFPKLAIGDGALGFWAALREVSPQSREQRCWVHKTANILDKMPKSSQAKAKTMIHNMYMAESKKEALKAFDLFLNTYEGKFPKACECLIKDKEELFTFYDFPAESWAHLRTTNPIESTFATVRLRTKKTKGCGSRIATLTMVWQLIREAQKKWRTLRGVKLIPDVLKGLKFVDGILDSAA